MAFFQNHWKTIGQDVCAVVLDALNLNYWTYDTNDTYIDLTTKIKMPTKVSKVIPISLYNVIYKIIVKVLANRLKSILPVIISTTQSIFVPKKIDIIQCDLAYKSIYTMQSRMKGSVGYMVLKLDISKTYDKFN